MKTQLKLMLLLSAASSIFISCQKEQSLKNVATETSISNSSANQGTKYNTFNGDEIALGNGYAHTFITQSHTGVPQELGIVFTDEALSGLPAANTPYVLDFHHKALESTPFKHLALGWNFTGHPLPPSGFIKSHFDIRFYMMSLEDRLAMPSVLTPEYYVLPPEGYMPANYFPDVPVPQIGMHWTEDNFEAGTTINHTMILGSYNGKFTFVSPIVVQTELASGTSVSLSYAQPQFFAEHGYYPTRYNIYQDDHKRHYITLSDFVWR